MKRVILFCFALIIGVATFGAEPDFSVKFAQYETGTLYLDVYMPGDDAVSDRYCIMYSYGGSFKHMNQKAKGTKAFCRRMADNGYVAVAVDYRLGMKGVDEKNKFAAIKPFAQAVDIATEDLFKAVRCVLDSAKAWKIRPDGIIVSGSSAGAIMSMQANWELGCRTPKTGIVPEDFRFAGVISFAGATFSTHGKCRFTVHGPAPTLMLHGTKDPLVPYNKIAFFGKRFSGSSDLAKVFAKNHYPYEIIRYVGEDHSVYKRMDASFDDVVWFLENMVKKARHFEIDKTVTDPERLREIKKK